MKRCGGRESLKFGLFLPSSGRASKPESLTSLAQSAEELGFDALGVSDHIVVPAEIRSTYPYSEHGRPSFGAEYLEQLTILSFLAAKTKKVRLMSHVMVLPHRNPILAAKVLT